MTHDDLILLIDTLQDQQRRLSRKLNMDNTSKHRDTPNNRARRLATSQRIGVLQRHLDDLQAQRVAK